MTGLRPAPALVGSLTPGPARPSSGRIAGPVLDGPADHGAAESTGCRPTG